MSQLDLGTQSLELERFPPQEILNIIKKPLFQVKIKVLSQHMSRRLSLYLAVHQLSRTRTMKVSLWGNQSSIKSRVR